MDYLYPSGLTDEQQTGVRNRYLAIIVIAVLIMLFVNYMFPCEQCKEHVQNEDHLAQQLLAMKRAADPLVTREHLPYNPRYYQDSQQ